MRGHTSSTCSAKQLSSTNCDIRGPQVLLIAFRHCFPPGTEIVYIFTGYIAAKCELIHTKKKVERRQLIPPKIHFTNGDWWDVGFG